MTAAGMAGNRYMCLGGYAVNIIIASVSGVGSEGGVGNDSKDVGH